jgi:hypothetical protein
VESSAELLWGEAGLPGARFRCCSNSGNRYCYTTATATSAGIYPSPSPYTYDVLLRAVNLFLDRGEFEEGDRGKIREEEELLEERKWVRLGVE